MKRIGSLCSGYGGLDLAAEQVFRGRTVWHAEYADAPSKILAHRWPGVPNLGDFTTTHWATVRPVEIITAGYPCQPFSHAGSRKGTDDERHLWPSVAEAVRRIRPRYVFLENVAGHRSLGFDVVLGDLAAMRYVGSWVSLRASDIGACHGRERVFILARDADSMAGATTGARGGRPGTVDEPGTVERALGPDCLPVPDTEGVGRVMGDTLNEWQATREVNTSGDDRLAAANSDRDGLSSVGWELAREHDAHGCGSADVAWGKYEPAIRRWEATLGRQAPHPTISAARGGRKLSPRFVEWMMGLPPGWVTDVPHLDDDEMLTALGNGVMPQQAAAAGGHMFNRLEAAA